MKIILSRKGFDSKYGGYPSPILPGGKMISLPIPSKGDVLRYSDLYVNDDSLCDLMKQLNPWINLESRPKIFSRVELTPEAECHLDPDINTNLKERSPHWKHLFGQQGSAQGHLDKQEVKEGDLFLFFGTFRKTILKENKLKFTGKEFHAIFGYLQVGRIIKRKEEIESWMDYHPHCREERDWSKNNTIYVASKKLSFNNNLPGAGVFRFHKDLILTKKGFSKSKWDLPKFFKNKISCHNEKNWNNDFFQSQSIGQEFVCINDSEIEGWAMNLINNSA